MPSALLPPKGYRSHHSESATQTLFYLKEGMAVTLGTHTETKDSHICLFSLLIACHFLGASTKPSSWLYHPHCPGLGVTWALGHLFHVDIIRSSGNKVGQTSVASTGLEKAVGEVKGSSGIVIVSPPHTPTPPAVAGLEVVARKLLLEAREV